MSVNKFTCLYVNVLSLRKFTCLYVSLLVFAFVDPSANQPVIFLSLYLFMYVHIYRITCEYTCLINFAVLFLSDYPVSIFLYIRRESIHKMSIFQPVVYMSISIYLSPPVSVCLDIYLCSMDSTSNILEVPS